MLPNLLCIGAAKCATTSLHEYLRLHPDVFMAEAKELDFFAGPGWSWDRGLDWYEQQFPVDAPVRGETSPTYSVHPFVEGAPERIAATLPEVKLIYIVGDPIERIVSDWVGNVASGYESKSLHDLIASPDFGGTAYVWRSRYAHQLGVYLDVFPRSSIHVVLKEDLIAQPETVMTEVFRFLGVDDSFTTPEFGRVHNPSSPKIRRRSYPAWMRSLGPLVNLKRRATAMEGRAGALARRALSPEIARPELSDPERRRIAAQLAADTEELRSLTGLGLDGWPKEVS